MTITIRIDKPLKTAAQAKANEYGKEHGITKDRCLSAWIRYLIMKEINNG